MVWECLGTAQDSSSCPVGWAFVQKSEPFQQVKKILPFTGEFSIGAPVEQACCWASWCEQVGRLFESFWSFLHINNYCHEFWSFLAKQTNATFTRHVKVTSDCQLRLSFQDADLPRDELLSLLDGALAWISRASNGLSLRNETQQNGSCEYTQKNDSTFNIQDIAQKRRVLWSWSGCLQAGGWYPAFLRGFSRPMCPGCFWATTGFANREAAAETVRNSTGDTKTWN